MSIEQHDVFDAFCLLEIGAVGEEDAVPWGLPNARRNICLLGCAPHASPHLRPLPRLEWLEPDEPVHSLTTPRLGVIAPGPRLTTLHTQRPPTRLGPAIHRQLPTRTDAPVFPFAPRRVVGDPTMSNPPPNSIGVVVCVSS